DPSAQQLGQRFLQCAVHGVEVRPGQRGTDDEKETDVDGGPRETRHVGSDTQLVDEPPLGPRVQALTEQGREHAGNFVVGITVWRRLVELIDARRIHALPYHRPHLAGARPWRNGEWSW